MTLILFATKKENKTFYLIAGKGNSSIVDAAGKTYPSSTLEYNGSTRADIDGNMSPGVDYVFDINFENIPAQATKAALVNITAQKVIQFRNIPFLN
jgi:hypothetical protein